jgi:Mn-containing catalase
MEDSMYHHVKKLMYDVHVGTPDVRFGKMLLEQFGGANGELAAAMQYTVQGWSCDQPEYKDLLMDIGTEEISHLEVVGALIRMHLRPMKKAMQDAEEDPLVAVTGGGGLNLYNSVGNAWTADYLKISGDLDVDFRNNMAAEARAKITYERLMHLTDDAGTKQALQFLMTREITHLKAFTAALESLGKDPFTIGMLPPTPGIVDEYYNDSTGSGAVGVDGVGKWIEKHGLRVAETPSIIKSLQKSLADNEKLAAEAGQTPLEAEFTTA